MKTSTSILAMMAFVGLLTGGISSSAFSEEKKITTEQQQTQTNQNQKSTTEQPLQTETAVPNGKDQILASDLEGKTVYNQNGEALGEVSDILVEPESGKIHAVVVSVGGFLGIGEKDIALKTENLRIERAANGSGSVQVIYETTRENLEGMPEFDAAEYTEYKTYRDNQLSQEFNPTTPQVDGGQQAMPAFDPMSECRNGTLMRQPMADQWTCVGLDGKIQQMEGAAIYGKSGNFSKTQQTQSDEGNTKSIQTTQPSDADPAVKKDNSQTVQ